MSSNENNADRRVVGFIGIGLDNQDGHQRLTQSEHFLLVGGSNETHERMQDTAIRFQQALRRRGKPLEDVPVQEVIQMLQDTRELQQLQPPAFDLARSRMVRNLSELQGALRSSWSLLPPLSSGMPSPAPLPPGTLPPN